MNSSYSSEEDNASNLSFLQGRRIKDWFAVELVDTVNRNNELIGYPFEMGPMMTTSTLLSGRDYSTSFAVGWIDDDKGVQWDQSVNSMPTAVAFEVQKEWIKVSLIDSGCDRTRQDAFFLPEPSPH